MSPGQIVILNGAPRSGKSSIVAAIQESFDGVWMNLGVDTFKECATPEKYSPGIGLRPGGECPDLEPIVAMMYRAMYASIAAHSRFGLNVAVDVGHHDGYSQPLGILPSCARLLDGLPALFVGVRCPVDVIMARRMAARIEGGTPYVVGNEDEPVPAPVRRWQTAVHQPGIYDLDVDTSILTPQQCAAEISRRLANGPPPEALRSIANLDAD
ncbi:MAG: chloramphenicol phosphotransferase [Pseudomonadota bacterium]